MVELDIDRSDIVLDPAVIFSQESPRPRQEDSDAGEEPKEAVPGGEVFLPGDLLVQVDRAEAPGRGQHREQVEDPEVKRDYKPVEITIVTWSLVSMEGLGILFKWLVNNEDISYDLPVELDLVRSL